MAKDNRSNANLGPVQQSQLWEVVANALRRAILVGDLKPGGKLIETDLAIQFNVSRGRLGKLCETVAKVSSSTFRGEVTTTMSIVPGGACRRQPVTVELWANDRPFGQVLEALVSVGGDAF